MSQTVDCLGCGDPLPLGRSYCDACRPRKPTIPGYRHYRRERAAVLATARVCELCGLPGRPDDPLTADHRVARANGGSHDRANLGPAHRSCNSAKGAGAPRVRGLRVR